MILHGYNLIIDGRFMPGVLEELEGRMPSSFERTSSRNRVKYDFGSGLIPMEISRIAECAAELGIEKFFFQSIDYEED